MGENTVIKILNYTFLAPSVICFSVGLLIITVKVVFNVHLFVCINRVLEINTFQLIVSII